MGTSYELTATTRDKVGKGAARAVRREGQIPAVIYGGKEPPIAISLSDREITLKIQAGGFLPTARQHEVALIRRGPGGVRMMRAIDLRPRRGEVVALRRGDIVFVPRSNLGEVANFVSLFRNALPIGFSYAIGGQYQSF